MMIIMMVDRGDILIELIQILYAHVIDPYAIGLLAVGGVAQHAAP